jgi:hypothetical protein
MDHSHQDDIFFNGASVASRESEDARLARELQRQLDLEDTFASSSAQPKSEIDSDAEYAKRLYEEDRKAEEERKATSSSVGGTSGPRQNRDREMEEKDAMLAKRLQDEEVKATTASPPSSSPNPAPFPPSCCPTCGTPCSTMSSSLTALGLTYCNNGLCFTCVLCSGPITTPTYQVLLLDGKRSPCHKECYVEAAVPKCVVCSNAVPSSGQGTYHFSKHPFFQDWKYCRPHETSSARCTSCGRVEPDRPNFNDLGDGRRICGSCARTTVLDSDELKPLFLEILEFLANKLGIEVWPDMGEIPVLSVAFQTLNERSTYSAHTASSGPVTRGLCMTETETSSHTIQVPSLSWEGRGGGYRVRNVSYALPKTSKSHVQAILVLSGLPRDLTKSILAHEAIHAWLKVRAQKKREG